MRPRRLVRRQRVHRKEAGECPVSRLIATILIQSSTGLGSLAERGPIEQPVRRAQMCVRVRSLVEGEQVRCRSMVPVSHRHLRQAPRYVGEGGRSRRGGP